MKMGFCRKTKLQVLSRAVRSKHWKPDHSFSRCVAVDDPLLFFVGAAPPRFEDSGQAGMNIWRGPEPVQWAPAVGDEPRAGAEPLVSPEGEAPDFFEIEEP